MNLSPTMMQVTEQMELHGELIRYPGGFWSWRDVEIKREIPVWYCDVKTLRALGKRGIVNLDETNSWHIGYTVQGRTRDLVKKSLEQKPDRQ